MSAALFSVPKNVSAETSALSCHPASFIFWLHSRSANYVVLGIVRWPITRRINAQPTAAGPALRRLRAYVPAVVRGVMC